MPPQTPNVRYRASAEADLTAITHYLIDKAGPATTRRFITRLRDACEMRAVFPEGATEVAPGIRAFPVGDYVVFYSPLDDGLDILAVKHARRDLPRLLQRHMGRHRLPFPHRNPWPT